MLAPPNSTQSPPTGPPDNVAVAFERARVTVEMLDPMLQYSMQEFPSPCSSMSVATLTSAPPAASPAALIANAVATAPPSATSTASVSRRLLQPLPEIPPKRKRKDGESSEDFEMYKQQRRKAQRAHQERSRNRVGRTHPARDRGIATRARQREEEMSTSMFHEPTSQTAVHFHESRRVVPASRSLDKLATAVQAASRTAATVNMARQFSPLEGRSTTLVTSQQGHVYCGEVIGGRPDGLGVCIKLNGDTYEGEWRSGKIEGHGRYMYAASKAIIEGEFRAGDREGVCMGLRPNAGIEITRYQADAPVGENVLFYIFPDGPRAYTYPADDSTVAIPLSLERAAAIAARLRVRYRSKRPDQNGEFVVFDLHYWCARAHDAALSGCGAHGALDLRHCL